MGVVAPGEKKLETPRFITGNDLIKYLCIA